MKRKILLIGVFALLVLSRTFAGQYVYKEASRDRGLVSAYVRFCAKSFKDDAATSESINVAVEAQLKGQEEASNTTGCFLSSISTYVFLKEEVWVITFLWEPYQRWGSIAVVKGSNSGKTHQLIYDTGTQYWSYNYLYELYQEQCNKYLNML